MGSRWLFLILAGLALGWFLKPKPLDTSLTNHPPQIEKQATLTPEPVASPSVKPAPVVLPSKVAVADKPKLPDEPYAGPMEYLHFKVEDGLAVAFGDLILGVPVSDSPIEEGFNKPNRPKPWTRPEIPYVIHPDLKNPERVEQAIQHMRENTVVNFVPFTNQADAIVFEPGDSNCKSYLGRIGGHQPIKLSDNCGYLEILHEMMHALGFVHEHSRTDREKYISINWDNVEDDFKPQYAMVTEDLMGNVRGFAFDFHSIMLYPPTMFAERTSEPTMRSKSTDAIEPSTRGLSRGDIERINKLFR
jgi:hypothetical protein